MSSDKCIVCERILTSMEHMDDCPVGRMEAIEQRMNEMEKERAARAAGSAPTEIFRGVYKLAEELGETLQIIGKLGAYPHGIHPDNEGPLYSRFEDELGDVLAAVDYLIDNEPRLSRAAIVGRRDMKYAIFTGWGLRGIR